MGFNIILKLREYKISLYVPRRKGRSGHGLCNHVEFFLNDKYFKSYDVSIFKPNLDGYGPPDWIILGYTYVGLVLRTGMFLNIYFVPSVAEFGMNH